MPDVYLGIGSNLGDRQANIERAVLLLKEDKDMDWVGMSSVIETAPEGDEAQPKFLNAAAHIRTELLPPDLLSRLKGIERRLGRQRSTSGSPRPMDLDILFYDDVVIVEGKTLSIPHPRLDSRPFVLKPLFEIAPDFMHPRLKKTVRELLSALTDDPTTSFGDDDLQSSSQRAQI